MVLNDRSDVEIALMLHLVFIHNIVKKESQDNSYVGQIKFCKVKAEFHTKLHFMTIDK